MKIVHATAECYPYAKTGGLADMVGSLATTFADNEHETSIFMPGYRVALDHPDTKLAAPLFPLKGGKGEVWAFSPRENLTVFLLCNNVLFDRNGLYGTDGRDFDDNHRRFMWFCRGVVEAMWQLKLHADVLHCHDWQTGLLPMMLRYNELRSDMMYAKKIIFTIHNIAFQGAFTVPPAERAESHEDLPGIESLNHYGRMNMLKGGILFSDHITTVSPRYAREIQTATFGCGLEGVIATKANRLTGLLNGIDPAVWNPGTDVHLPARYSAADIGGKSVCRNALLEKAAFDPAFKGPVFGMICRLTEQKGLDLIFANTDFFLGECRLIVLGSGERTYEDAMGRLADTAPDRICFCKRFDEGMSHLIEAGSDFFLMPSLYEPCGLNQMYSLAYGTVPLVSRVGGLLDTVTDVDEEPDAGTGLTFQPTAKEFRAGLVRAASLYAEKPRFAAVQQRGMRKDFSWATAALAYERLYRAPAGAPVHIGEHLHATAEAQGTMAVAM